MFFTMFSDFPCLFCDKKSNHYSLFYLRIAGILLLLSLIGRYLCALLVMAIATFVPRLALSNIIRPGSPVRSVIIAFGLGYLCLSPFQ